VNAAGTATGRWSSGIDSWTWAAGAELVTCVIVQQHAARTDPAGAGGFGLLGCALVGQQHAARVIPSYTQRYNDAVAVDGARTKTSRSGTTRRTQR